MVKNAKFSKEDLQKEMVRLVESLGKVPTRLEFLELNCVEACYKQTFSLVYSSYMDLLRDCGLPARNKTRDTLNLGCSCCGKPLTVKEDKRNNNYFCDHSCAAIYSNASRARAVRDDKVCPNCGTAHKGSVELCSNKCRIEHRAKNTRLEDCLTQGSSQQKFSNVRGIARNYAKYLPNKSMCQNCGYSKHTEIAHVKDVSSFDMSALVWEVNHESNLLALCRNCHWEFDKGELGLAEIEKSDYYVHDEEFGTP